MKPRNASSSSGYFILDEEKVICFSIFWNFSFSSIKIWRWGQNSFRPRKKKKMTAWNLFLFPLSVVIMFISPSRMRGMFLWSVCVSLSLSLSMTQVFIWRQKGRESVAIFVTPASTGICEFLSSPGNYSLTRITSLLLEQLCKWLFLLKGMLKRRNGDTPILLGRKTQRRKKKEMFASEREAGMHLKKNSEQK